MSNIEFVHFDREISEDQVEKVLREVVTSLFGDYLRVSRDEHDWFYVSIPKESEIYDERTPHLFSFRCRGPKEIGGKTEDLPFRRWTQRTVMHHLVSQIGGDAFFFDECDPDHKWKSDTSRYRTYKEYLEEIWIAPLEKIGMEDLTSWYQGKVVIPFLEKIPEQLRRKQQGDI